MKPKFSAALFVSCLAVLSGCSSATHSPDSGKRALASGANASASLDLSGLESELSEKDLSLYFKTLWNGNEPSQKIEQAIDQLVKVFYGSERHLRLFDRELDQAAVSGVRGRNVLARMKSYPRMLAFAEVSHRATQRISYVYEQVLKIYSNPAKSATERRRAEEVLSAFDRIFIQASGADRLALHSLSIELKSVYDRFDEKGNALVTLRHASVLENTLFENGESIGDFARRADVRSELKQRVQDSQDATQDPDVEDSSNETLNSLTKHYRTEIQSFLEKGREPQAEEARFFPSSGSHGSVSGDEYPKRTWSLTFDDGPSAKYSPMVLKNLKDHDLHATFFELATNVAAIPKTSLAIRDAGMEMANHSYTHPQLPKIDDAHLRHEVVDSTNVEVRIWGEDHHPKLFRCPYGAGLTIKRVRDMIAKNGFIHVFWNVDTLDWQDKNPDSILARAKKQMLAEGRGIVLFHDVHPQSVEASRMVMDWIKQQGYRHETVGAVLQELNQNASKHP